MKNNIIERIKETCEYMNRVNKNNHLRVDFNELQVKKNDTWNVTYVRIWNNDCLIFNDVVEVPPEDNYEDHRAAFLDSIESQLMIHGIANLIRCDKELRESRVNKTKD